MTLPPADITPPPAAPEGDGRFRIGMMITTATMLFLLTAVLLYYRSATMIEPSCVIVVNASPALKGAKVSVSSVMLAQPLEIEVGTNDRYSFPFYVDPGEYELKVVLDGETQITRTVAVNKRARGLQVDLTKFKPTTVPAAEP